MRRPAKKLSTPRACRAAALWLGLALSVSAAAQQPPSQAPMPAAIDPSAIRVLLVAELETTLSAQMNGTLGDLKASLGRQVPKGALLVQLQCSEAQARANGRAPAKS